MADTSREMVDDKIVDDGMVDELWIEENPEKG